MLIYSNKLYEFKDINKLDLHDFHLKSNAFVQILFFIISV